MTSNKNQENRLRKLQTSEYYPFMELLEEMEALFREHNSSRDDIRQACVHMLVKEGIRDGATERKAHEDLVRHFKTCGRIYDWLHHEK